MNVIIGEIFKNFLTGVNFVDKLGGLVKTVEITQGNKSIKKAPVDYSLTQHNTKKYDHLTYVPDSSKRSIIYFEDGGITIVRDGSKYVDLVSSIKLVAWFNLDRINKSLNNGSQLLLILMDAIPKSFPSQSNILKGRIEFIGQDERSADIFSEYEYDEAQLQYLIHPFDYGALNYNVHFSMNPLCTDPIEIIPADCLTSPIC